MDAAIRGFISNVLVHHSPPARLSLATNLWSRRFTPAPGDLLRQMRLSPWISGHLDEGIAMAAHDPVHLGEAGDFFERLQGKAFLNSIVRVHPTEGLRASLSRLAGSRRAPKRCASPLSLPPGTWAGP